MSKFEYRNDIAVVSTDKGKIRGYYYDDTYRFLGIPYAKAKRFMMPEEFDAWEGVRDAVDYGLVCPILSEPRPVNQLLMMHNFWPASENCHFLNVWTRELNKEAKKPVLVWFHGGGYAAGSSLEMDFYHGANLAKKDDVVVVTVNHRLNVFGYLDLSSFGEKYHNSGNAGIADLIASLKWVRNNIASFGGDPDNVTIFGQSGGGNKVTTLCQIPAAKGLFHKAVIISGVFSDQIFVNPVSGRELALNILKQLSLGEEDIQKLETVSTADLIRATNAASRALGEEGKDCNWFPIANDWFPGYPLQYGFAESCKDIPTIVGTCISEFNLNDQRRKDTLSTDEREAIVTDFYGEGAKEVIDLFEDAYPGKNIVYSREVDTATRMSTIDYVKKKASVSNVPTYCYIFSPEFDFDGGRLAWHCADIPYFFHNCDRTPYSETCSDTESIEKTMSSYLINFARTGNPNGEGLPKWEESTAEDVYTMVFDSECICKKNFDEKLVKAINKLIPPMPFNIPTLPDEENFNGVY